MREDGPLAMILGCLFMVFIIAFYLILGAIPIVIVVLVMKYFHLI